MGGFNSLQFDDRQDSTQSYPVSSTAAAPSSLQGSSHGINIGFNPGQPPQANDMSQQNYPLLDHVSGRPTGSMAFAGNPAAGYHFGPSPTGNDPNDGPDSAMMFANSATSQPQHPHPSGHMYDGAAERFQLQQGYVPPTFTPALDPMAAFGNYAAPHNYQNPPMGLPLTYGGPAPPSQHPMNMIFSTATYEPTLQPSMQGPVAAGPNQENWLTMSSNFNLPLAGQNLQIETDHLAAPSQNTNPDVDSGSFVTSDPPTRPNNTPSVQTPFIPPEIAASAVPKPGRGKVASQYLNVYSSSGFDMFSILAKIASRPNPEIDIGAVDMSCAFILCDITSHDDPIAYVSDAFERLTGYTRHEILGRNCRFLQAPDGKVNPGIKRKYVDDETVYRLREKIRSRSEVQVSMINYRKGGQSFMNLLTMIPIRWGSPDYRFYVGFQVDLVEQPQAVTKRNSDGSYTINYQRDQLSRYVLHAPDSRKPQNSLSKNISHNEVTSALRSIGAGTKDISSRYLDRVLLENADDVIHVLSLKGLFLYLSQSSRRLLEYEPNELVGKSISSVCHPSDIAPVTRELKQATVGTSVSVVYRIRRKNSGYVWFESHGSLHVEPGKGRKCLILVGRERPVYTLDWPSVLEVGGIGEGDLWTKMSISGMFLFVSSNARVLLDRTPDEMTGKGIQEFMRNESRGELGKALEIARTGHKAIFKHEIRHKRGHVLQAQTTLFPGDAAPGTKPSYLVAQTRLVKSSRASYLPQRNPVLIASSTADSSANSYTTPLSPGPGNQTSFAKQTKSTTRPGPGQVAQRASTEAGSHGLPLGNQDEALVSDNNIFEELKSVRSSSWQFELRQLERHNRLLAEELQALISRRKKRKRKKGTGPMEKACTNCSTRNTPEWRRGPSGNRDLCNSCGLRWAKQNGRISPRKPPDQNDRNSSSSSAKPSPGSVTEDRPEIERSASSGDTKASSG
ncbi:uncharacterized protein TRUGW13939_11597 [Talaromyces rugulosus]|uniref:Uncharacterized protein n=1 Tax=Talaromyces rugulosus TaxID=121627 RepID=A0A7H8RII3_TALRU|nr:uncharacterized protein TRUGW13939_11597 [Talaromyces rugulosus]QKX64423.1 hypothetical protein TRUGW13939_11597 [Talaromyces rugulosus]